MAHAGGDQTCTNECMRFQGHENRRLAGHENRPLAATASDLHRRFAVYIWPARSWVEGKPGECRHRPPIVLLEVARTTALGVTRLISSPAPLVYAEQGVHGAVRLALNHAMSCGVTQNSKRSE